MLFRERKERWELKEIFPFPQFPVFQLFSV